LESIASLAAVPIHITTERLLIRPLAPTDIEAMHAVFSDPEVMRYVPAGACDHERSLARLRSLIEHQRQHGFSKWAVAEKASGHLIGDCGLQYLDGGPDIELGFHLARAHWGHGYATEAARACLAWALAERAERVVAIVDPANQQSVRVLDKIGMLPAGAESHFGRWWLLYVASPHDRDH
jgi:ribosomal-protein-alanine N-acetyltransferase